MSARPATMKVNYIEVKLQYGDKLKIPYWKIDSGQEGPCLLVIAGQHGNEVNGCEVIRRFLESIRNCLKKGMLYAVPFANILAMHKRRSHLDLGPEQPYLDTEHNMQMKWPGKKDGNNTERVAAALWDAVVKQATHVIDIHSYSCFFAPTILYRSHYSPENEALARVMAFRFLFCILENDPDDWPGAIGNQVGAAGKASIGMELCGQYEVEGNEVKRGLSALINVAKYLGMIAGKPEVRQEPIILYKSSKIILVKTKQSGLFVKANLSPGDYVRKGDYLGHIFSEATLEVKDIIAPVSGYLKMYRGLRKHVDVSLSAQHPYADVGDRIAQIVPHGK